jgi:calcineurin-like phosphoesterase family protein
VEEMNQVLLKNWNGVITNEDKVYYLGDISFGRNCHEAKYWWDKLNGDKTLIMGNHDRFNEVKSFKNVRRNLYLQFEDIKFELIHSPEYMYKKEKDRWVIHGHHHNNFPELYPLINRKNKTINVSVEMINYKPLELQELLELITTGDVTGKH